MRLPTPDRIALVAYSTFLVGLLCSRTLLTVGMVLMVVASWVTQDEAGRWAFNAQWRRPWAALRPTHWAMIGIWVLIGLSAFNSTNLHEWAQQWRVKLPFLVMPIAFAMLPRLSEKQFNGLLRAFVALTAVAGAGVLINYALDFEAITDSLHRGKSIPTPIHHIRFSLLVALSVVCGSWLLLHTRDAPRWLWLALTVFNLVTVHILTVRSGLLTLYAGMGLLLVMTLWQRRQRWLVLAIVVGLPLLPLAAYWTIPSVQSKVGYMLQDLDMFRQGRIKGFSDGQRLVSLMVGWQVFQDAPHTGVGVGDLRDSMTAYYAAAYPELEAKLPHNQWLWLAASLGWVGLLAFAGLWIWPLLRVRRFLDPLWAAFYGMMFLSFQVENTLSTAFGTGIFLFFLLLLVQRERV